MSIQSTDQPTGPFSRTTPGPRPAPAALERAGLTAALAPFGQSRMLPRAAYTHPEVLDWERREVFGRWACLGRAADLADAGAQCAYRSGGESVLLVRGDDGELRGFANVCRHRGHELLPVDGTASARSIVCPYHAWSYRLDGSLQAAPGFRDLPGFDPAAHGLVELPVHDWHGWLFVDTSGSAGPFADHVGSLEQVVGPYELERLVFGPPHSYDVAANWKVVIENYQECYHCAMIHPELCRVTPPKSGDDLVAEGAWVGGWMDLRESAETMSLDGHSRGAVIATLGEHERRTVMYLAVLPNLLVSLHPDYVMVHHLTPLAPDRTRISCAWGFPAEVAAAADFDPSYAVDFWDLTNRQDWAACESVQRGLRSRHWRPGPLAPEETGVYHFVSYMARRYLDG